MEGNRRRVNKKIGGISNMEKEWSEHDKKILRKTDKYLRSRRAKKRGKAGIPMFGNFGNLGLKI